MLDAKKMDCYFDSMTLSSLVKTQDFGFSLTGVRRFLIFERTLGAVFYSEDVGGGGGRVFSGRTFFWYLTFSFFIVMAVPAWLLTSGKAC